MSQPTPLLVIPLRNLHSTRKPALRSPLVFRLVAVRVWPAPCRKDKFEGELKLRWLARLTAMRRTRQGEGHTSCFLSSRFFCMMRSLIMTISAKLSCDMVVDRETRPRAVNIPLHHSLSVSSVPLPRGYTCTEQYPSTPPPARSPAKQTRRA